MRLWKHLGYVSACLIVAQLVAQQSALPTPDDFFRRAGTGLRVIEAERSAYWQPHITNSRRRILAAAALCKRHSTALILGAGNCTEIPLAELARSFDEVVLVDLDEDSMAAAVANLPQDLIPKVHRQVADVTSFAAPLMRRLWKLFETAGSAERAFDGLQEILNPPGMMDASPKLPQADLVVSSLVLSAVHPDPRSYSARLLRDKFGERLTAWAGYENFRARLQQIALADHVALLAACLRPDGAAYFADTIARGPLYENIQPAQKQAVFNAMQPDLARLGFFHRIQNQGPLRQTFMAAFGKMRARGDSAGQAQRADAPDVIEQLAGEQPGVSSADQMAACETVVNLLCEQRFPVAAEVAAFERLLKRYAALPDSFEPLVPLEAVQKEWQKAGLEPSGPAESWLWLEYPCSISYSSGAFQIRSWILSKN